MLVQRLLNGRRRTSQSKRKRAYASRDNPGSAYSYCLGRNPWCLKWLSKV